MKICSKCGGAKFAPGEIAGWAGKVCYCQDESQKFGWLPLTEDDVRRIVREELKKFNEDKSKNL